MKESEWLDTLSVWAGLWPRQSLPPESVGPWYLLLRDLDTDAVRGALIEWAADGTRPYPPNSVGQLRAAALPQPPGWEQGLKTLEALVARHGSHVPRPSSEVIGDPALELVIGWYGWRHVCNLNAGDTTTRAQFRDTYRAAVAQVGRLDRRALAAGALPALEGARHG